MTLTCSPAGWREVTIQLLPAVSLDTPWTLHVFCDAGSNLDYTLDELKFIGAAIMVLADRATGDNVAQGEMQCRFRLRQNGGCQ